MTNRNRATVAAVMAAVAVAVVTALGLRTSAQAPAGPAGAYGDPRGNGQTMAIVPYAPTRLEAFAAQRGVVVTKSFTAVGELAGDDGSSVQVTAVQFGDAANPAARDVGVALHVREPQGGRQAVAYVDSEDIDPLLSAIDALAKLQATTSALQDFEGRYKTRGNVEIANASANGARSAGVRAVELQPLTGELVGATAQLRLTRLPELRQLIVTARQTLDRAGDASTQQK